MTGNGAYALAVVHHEPKSRSGECRDGISAAGGLETEVYTPDSVCMPQLMELHEVATRQKAEALLNVGAARGALEYQHNYGLSTPIEYHLACFGSMRFLVLGCKFENM